MLVLSLLIFMATVPVGNCFYGKTKTSLKTGQLRRGTFKRVRGLVSGDHLEKQRPIDTTNTKRVKVSNGFPITAGFWRKRKITLAESGSLRSRRARGKVQSSSILNSQC